MPAFLDYLRRSAPTAAAGEKSVQAATPRASASDPAGAGRDAAGTNVVPDLEAGGSPTVEEYEGWVDPYGPAPTFKQWIKWYWHDVLAFVFLGALALWLLMWSPIPYRKLFAIPANPNIRNGAPLPPEMTAFAYPKRKQIISIIADAMIAVFVPIISILLINLLGIATHSPTGHRLPRSASRGGTCLRRRGSFWNINNATLGVIYSVMTGATLQIIIKLVIAGLRPHFLTVCDPQPPPSTRATGEGFGGVYYDYTVCRDYSSPSRRDEIANAMQSFPSGHALAAWAGLFYLSLYINAHLKIFANYHASYWKLLLFVAPMLAATLLAGSLTLDASHNWYDIVVGSLVGVGMAVLAYRMCFAAVWDFRVNHVPLIRTSRGKGFGYGVGEMEAWSGGCATRRGGWGVASRYGGGRLWGAPGDCSCSGSGSGSGLGPRG